MDAPPDVTPLQLLGSATDAVFQALSQPPSRDPQADLQQLDDTLQRFLALLPAARSDMNRDTRDAAFRLTKLLAGFGSSHELPLLVADLRDHLIAEGHLQAEFTNRGLVDRMMQEMALAQLQREILAGTVVRLGGKVILISGTGGVQVFGSPAPARARPEAPPTALTRLGDTFSVAAEEPKGAAVQPLGPHEVGEADEPCPFCGQYNCLTSLALRAKRGFDG